MAKRIARDLDNEVLPVEVFDYLSDTGALDMRLVSRWKGNKPVMVRYFPLWQIHRLDKMLDQLRRMYIKGLIEEETARKLLFRTKFNVVKE